MIPRTRHLNSDTLFTVKEVAEGLLVTFLTVYAWTGKDDSPLPVLRFGETQREIRISEKALIKWLKKERPMLLPIWKDRDRREKIEKPQGPAEYQKARIDALVNARVQEEVQKILG